MIKTFADRHTEELLTSGRSKRLPPDIVRRARWQMSILNTRKKEVRPIHPGALRLSRLFGNSPEFWLNAQRAVDLWDATQEIGSKVERIKPLTVV